MVSATLADTLGMEYIGFALATWLFGVNTVQVFTYFQKYNDRLFVKLTVVAVAILNSSNAILTCCGLYLQIVPNSGKPINFNVPLAVEPIVTALNAFIVECFLSHSIYRISERNKFLTVSICILAVAQLAFAVAECIQIILSLPFVDLHTGTNVVITAISVGFSALTDVVITASLVVYFVRGRSSIGPNSDVLNKLIVYAVQRTVMITVPQILLVAFLFAMPDTLIWYIFQFIEGPVYTYTFLAILNRRECLRQAGSAHTDEVQYMPRLLVSSATSISHHDGV